MAELWQFKQLDYRRPKKFIWGRGKGSGGGKTAGRGSEGQKSRSGYSARPIWEGGTMPLIRRLPKKGFKNSLFKKNYTIVNVGKLNILDNDTEVTPNLLIEKGIISKINKDGIKILGKGELIKKLHIKAHACSKTAKEKIEKLNGSISILS
jgi:large subunit ribosomal protein L15